jgi:pimeloyl-ACP methyl ester carboxylesterase
MTEFCDAAQLFLFTIAITCISRLLLGRDRLIGRAGRRMREAPTGVARIAIPSGKNVLDAVLVRSDSSPERAVVLICHGIGEVVEHWFAVQRLLAECGVASLVFDYSGYGRSTGSISPGQCEEDALSAFAKLGELIPSRPISVLGFSLGSGIAATLIAKVKVHHLVLCASFTSFRAAALSAGLPRILIFLVPAIWSTEDVLKSSTVPILIVHGAEDRLFPPAMARELNAQGGSKSELVIIPRLAHDDPYREPQRHYWDVIASRLK